MTQLGVTCLFALDKSMPPPTWLFEADVFRLADDALKHEVRRQGMRFHVVRQPPSGAVPGQLVGAPLLPEGSCVVFRGSWPLMRHIQL